MRYVLGQSHIRPFANLLKTCVPRSQLHTGTDVHFRETDMVLGHESAAIVVELGSTCTRLKKQVPFFLALFPFPFPCLLLPTSLTNSPRGDRVGWGFQRNACFHCTQCLNNTDQFCADREFYGEQNLDQGSFASHAVWKEAYLFKIPDSIPQEVAGPLMCGGITVFSALQNLQPYERVGIIGVGGLGHMAIQFASKMGAEVVVFSGTERKKEEAMGLGASEFNAMKGVTDLKGKIKPIQRLLVTTSQLPDWDLYLPMLSPLASIFPIGLSQDKVSVPAMAFVLQGVRLIGTCTGPISLHRAMLEFAGRHGIKPITQEFPMTVEGIEEAFDVLGKGKMRYRGVLVVQDEY
jgi:D-arabinose 1-dehydrogenase-like Zn-dependent alcohol dehydrogenase